MKKRTTPGEDMTLFTVVWRCLLKQGRYYGYLNLLNVVNGPLTQKTVRYLQKTRSLDLSRVRRHFQKKSGRQTDRLTDRLTDRQKDRQTDRDRVCICRMGPVSGVAFLAKTRRSRSERLWYEFPLFFSRDSCRFQLVIERSRFTRITTTLGTNRHILIIFCIPISKTSTTQKSSTSSPTIYAATKRTIRDTSLNVCP